MLNNVSTLSWRLYRCAHSSGWAQVRLLAYQWICGSGGFSAARPVKASRTWSTVAVTMPIVLSTVGFGGVPGCGRVGAIFFARSSFSPSFVQVLPTHRGFKLREHDILLVGDVLAARLDEML